MLCVHLDQAQREERWAAFNEETDMQELSIRFLQNSDIENAQAAWSLHFRREEETMDYNLMLNVALQFSDMRTILHCMRKWMRDEGQRSITKDSLVRYSQINPHPESRQFITDCLEYCIQDEDDDGNPYEYFHISLIVGGDPISNTINKKFFNYLDKYR